MMMRLSNGRMGAPGDIGGSSRDMEKSNNDSSSSSCFEDENIGHELSGVLTNVEEEETKEVPTQLAEKETCYVHILRVVVISLMVSAAIAVAVTVYMYVKDAQEVDLAENFYDLSYRLVDGFHANTKLRFQLLDAFSTQVTASALATRQTWPFVTIENFEAIGTAARSIVDSYYMALYPLVTKEQRPTWNEYTANNTYWLPESYTYQRDFFDLHNRTVGSKAPALDRRRLRLDGLQHGRGLQVEVESEPVEAEFDGPENITTDFYRYPREGEEDFTFVVDQSEGPYLPIWQVTPSRDKANIDINYNMYDSAYAASYAAAFESLFESEHAIFGPVWNADGDGLILEDDDYDYRTEPAAALFYPVFDTILGGLNRTLVASLEMDVEFGALFASVLPSNSNRLVCVIQNTCGQTFSFDIFGQISTYLGPGDQHDTKFDDMVVSALLTALESSSASKYNGVELNMDFCPWVLHIYGTQEMYDSHINSEPVVYLCAVLGIFLFTCFVFVMYDCLVEFRQRKVEKTAHNSEQIVNSLFPKAFRDKMYTDNKKQDAAAKKKQGPNSFQAAEVSHFLNHEQTMVQHDRGSIHDSPPMAELYPNCKLVIVWIWCLQHRNLIPLLPRPNRHSFLC
jgi:hypothetical protein